MIFVDTSAFYALAAADDRKNDEARRIYRNLADADESAATTNYVVLETLALVQRRLGQRAAHTFIADILPFTQLHHIDRATHEEAVELFLGQARRHLSLVDCSSILCMRSLGITRAFAFDRDFEEFGMELLSAR